VSEPGSGTQVLLKNSPLFPKENASSVLSAFPMFVRACLGKMMHFNVKMAQRTRYRTVDECWVEVALLIILQTQRTQQEKTVTTSFSMSLIFVPSLSW
jgi:hypothetical protein